MGRVKNIDKSIEELIQEHVIIMRDITGNPDYNFSKLDLVMYLADQEAKARSPPVIMPKTYQEIRLSTVFGPVDENKPKSPKY
ncbi:MAG: hypothetical protein AABY26_03645 [Nanoarchaeota archaeon]